MCTRMPCTRVHAHAHARHTPCTCCCVRIRMCVCVYDIFVCVHTIAARARGFSPQVALCQPRSRSRVSEGAPVLPRLDSTEYQQSSQHWQCHALEVCKGGRCCISSRLNEALEAHGLEASEFIQKDACLHERHPVSKVPRLWAAHQLQWPHASARRRVGGRGAWARPVRARRLVRRVGSGRKKLQRNKRCG